MRMPTTLPTRLSTTTPNRPPSKLPSTRLPRGRWTPRFRVSGKKKSESLRGKPKVLAEAQSSCGISKQQGSAELDMGVPGLGGPAFPKIQHQKWAPRGSGFGRISKISKWFQNGPKWSPKALGPSRGPKKAPPKNWGPPGPPLAPPKKNPPGPPLGALGALLDPLWGPIRPFVGWGL